MAMLRCLLFVLSCCLIVPLHAREPAVPPSLQPWRDWVLHDLPWIACSSRLGSDPTLADSRVCAWPGPLRLQVDADSARFSQRWTLQRPGLIDLPGDARLRPLELQVDGSEAAALLVDGRPRLQLPAGSFTVEGVLRWQRRPESLPIPDSSGLLALQLDGVEIAQVDRRDGQLWLGRSAPVTVSDSLSLRVYRLLEDGVPMRLHSEFQLQVAGRAREVELPRPLPEGFVPIALDSNLPVALGSDGQMRVQLRPGSWWIRLSSRAAQPGDEFALSERGSPWPTEEIWSFRAVPELRVVQPEGTRPVDPHQVGAPWQAALPSFALADGDVLRLTAVSRGRDPDSPHRLQLQRDLWLDFDGAAYTARDRISGQLSQADRLDLRAPWTLQRAAQSGQDLLVTEGAEPGLSGIELRSLQVDLDVGARHDSHDLQRASGWQQDFESMRLQLQLPPGWRLLAVGGADRAASAWIEGWRLLDWFWLSVLSLLAYRWAGWRAAAMVALMLLLAYREAQLPLAALSLALATALIASVVPAGRWQRVSHWLQRASAVLVLLLALPFLYQQLRLVLYPQLEHADVRSAQAGYYYEEAVADAVFLDAPPPPPPAPAAPPAEMPARSLDRIEISGSRVKRADLQSAPSLEQYPKDAIVQAGAGLPDWAWNSHRIEWNGPVLQDQTLSLWLLSPWQNRLWRLLQSGLLIAVLLLLLQRARTATPGASTARRSAVLSVLLGLALPLQAAEFPDAELLSELRQRLLQPADCAPRCAALERLELRVEDNLLSLRLSWQAAEATAVALPSSGERWQPSEVRVDGNASEVVWQDGQRWVDLPAGASQVELIGRLAGLDSLDLRFLDAPAWIESELLGWELAGISEHRLSGDSLQLVRAAEPDQDGQRSLAGGEFPPFVRVTRRLQLGLEWTLNTWVDRVAPAQSGFSLSIPLLPGEQVQDEEIEVEDGQARLSFAAGQDRLHWRSRLPISEQLQFAAADLERHSERWEVEVGAFWNARFDGLPELNQDAGETLRSFQPLPGEHLNIRIQRPAALRGDSVAVDRAEAEWSPGQRSVDVQLTAALRATRGGQHRIQLPAQAELISVELRNEVHNLRLHQGALDLPLLPGQNALQLQFRLADESGLWRSTQTIDLGAAAANLRSVMHPGGNRWIWWVSGEGLTPAVMLWPQLLLMALFAAALARLQWTPLRWHHWLLLGLGFSTVSWWAALPVVAWLLALGWRHNYTPRSTQRWRHALLQLGLIGLSLFALLCLIAAIPYGLLGQPDMQIAGSGSSSERLVAFLDRSAGALPQLGVLSLPLWLYQLAILAWSLWLANALIGWLRWGAQAMGRGGWWPARRAPAPAPEPHAAPIDPSSEPPRAG